MRHVLDILRLSHEGRSQREIAASLAIAQSSVSLCLTRFRASGLTWPLPADLDDTGLERRLFARTGAAVAPLQRPVPDWGTVRRELQRPGVTLQLLWTEYQQAHDATPERAHCYQYTQFCTRYHAWAAQLDPVLRQVHTVGERTFVDYAGPTMEVVDLDTGEVREAQIFVGVLGASHLVFAEATWTQQLPDWIASHIRLVEYVGGVTALFVPDNLRAGVTHACFYEPVLNPTYQDFATHYATAILPTRAFRPRDKAKVETGVLMVEREVLAPLRDHRFTSLASLNTAIAERVELLNNRPFQLLAGSRRSVFEAVERVALRPLPAARYEFATWRTAKVHIDYHVSVEGHFYSVPHALLRATVQIRLTATMVEILAHGTRVAAHRRSVGPEGKGRFTTDAAHRPKSHQAHLEWTPERFIRWGREIGPATGAVVTHLLEHRPHPEQGYRSCLGLLSLARHYPAVRLEAACHRAEHARTRTYRSVKSILVAGLDQVPFEDPPTLDLPPTHAHVRGAEYYRTALPPSTAAVPEVADALPLVD